MIPTDRPLAWVDAETTGTSPNTDRIVELAVGIQAPGSAWDEIEWKVRRMNPGVPIPPEATEVHGIRDEDLAGLPGFDAFAKALYALLEPCDLAGFGIRRFDVPLLVTEFRRCGIIFDARARRLIDCLSIFYHQEPRDLSGASRFYLGRELEGAHSAQADVAVCPEILAAQVARYGLPQDLGGLQAYLDEHSPYRDALETWFEIADREKPVNWVFRRGKWQGYTLGWVGQNEQNYLWWMLYKAEDMPLEVIDAVQPFYRKGS